MSGSGPVNSQLLERAQRAIEAAQEAVAEQVAARARAEQLVEVACSLAGFRLVHRPREGKSPRAARKRR
jgi:hypothetical protein